MCEIVEKVIKLRHLSVMKACMCMLLYTLSTREIIRKRLNFQTNAYFHVSVYLSVCHESRIKKCSKMISGPFFCCQVRKELYVPVVIHVLSGREYVRVCVPICVRASIRLCTCMCPCVYSAMIKT